MAYKPRLVPQSDFTGGLNLRANPFQLGDSESPNLMNVDLDPRGGVRRRGGVQPYLSNVGATPASIINHLENSGATDQLLVDCTDGTLKLRSGSSWVNKATSRHSAGRSNWASLNGKTYIVNGTDPSVSWDGTTLVALGETWNTGPLEEELRVYSDGNMPKAYCIATLGESNGYMFLANTVEGTNVHPSRVRWSFPTSADGSHGPEDWRDCDYIDLDPDSGGDKITAMVPFAEGNFVIFKRNSVWGLYGTPPDNIYPRRLATNIGAISSRAVATDGPAVYFFSWPEGVFRLTSDGFEWLSEPLMPLIDEGVINAASRDQISLAVYNHRLYVSVPTGTSTVNNRTYVFDTTQKSWTVYSFGAGQMYVRDSGGAVTFIATPEGNGNTLLSLSANADQDNFGSGSVGVPAWYQTRWFADTSPFTTKRWRRPEYVVKLGRNTDTLGVSIYHDMATTPVRTHTIAPGTTSLVNVRGDLMGKAKCVSLRFDGPAAGDRKWELNALTLKAIDSRVEF